MEFIKGKALENRIATLSKRSKELVKEIHFLAKSCCVVAVETGNLTMLLKLDKACEDIGGRALRRWLAKHGPVKWDNEKSRFVFSDVKREAAKADVKAYKAELDKAKTYVAESVKSDKNPFDGWDLSKSVKAIVRRYEKMTPEQLAHPKNKLRGIDKIIALSKELDKAPPAPKNEKVIVRRGRKNVHEAAAAIQ